MDEMFDLENDLPDELMASSSWTTTDNNNIHTNDTPGTGPGPGSGPGPGGPLIGAQDTNSNAALHRHVSHPALMHQAKGLVSNQLLTGGGGMITKKATAGNNDVVVNFGNISNVSLPNQGLPISMSGMSNNSLPITSSVMTNNVLNQPAMHGHHGIPSNLPNESIMSAQAVAAMRQQQHNSHLVPPGGQSSHVVGHPVSVGQNQGSRLQAVPGLPTVNNMSQTTNLLANGGTNSGNVGCYSYQSSSQNALGTSQVSVVLQQRNVPNMAALQVSRFSTSTTTVTGTLRNINIVGENGPLSGAAQVQNAPSPQLQSLSLPSVASAPSQANPPGLPTVGPQQAAAMASVNVLNPQANLPQRSATAPDPEKRRLIQQQLVLLLHAHQCQKRESQAAEEAKPSEFGSIHL